ncbi:hypothetical protein [Stenotrophomonas maltophilia]|uniref:hypothetical protein n=1 Tax=Stenotrophomonas maltophilia TaxID=40324 RepID=UPI0039C42A8D
MANVANINYIHYLYYPLLSMPDDELAAFEINDAQDRAWLFGEMVKVLETFGPAALAHVCNSLAFPARTNGAEDHWRNLIPHELPLGEVGNRAGYLSELFLSLFHRLPVEEDWADVELSLDLPANGLRTNI